MWLQLECSMLASSYTAGSKLLPKTSISCSPEERMWQVDLSPKRTAIRVQTSHEIQLYASSWLLLYHLISSPNHHYPYHIYCRGMVMVAEASCRTHLMYSHPRPWRGSIAFWALSSTKHLFQTYLIEYINVYCKWYFSLAKIMKSILQIDHHLNGTWCSACMNQSFPSRRLTGLWIFIIK